MVTLFFKAALATPLTTALLLALLSCASAPTLAIAEQDKPDVETDAVSEEAKSPEEILAEAIEEWDITNPPGEWGWQDAAIDTDEGTWISLDVSPDGSKIVFDLLGDIYKIGRASCRERV